jgi:hypothetical protein
MNLRFVFLQIFQARPTNEHPNYYITVIIIFTLRFSVVSSQMLTMLNLLNVTSHFRTIDVLAIRNSTETLSPNRYVPSASTTTQNYTRPVLNTPSIKKMQDLNIAAVKRYLPCSRGHHVCFTTFCGRHSLQHFDLFLVLISVLNRRNYVHTLFSHVFRLLWNDNFLSDCTFRLITIIRSVHVLMQYSHFAKLLTIYII